jgi:dTDP-4-amino-4,6-dideoxygalactose transaminase
MGYNSRLDDLHAGILSVKLRHLRHWTDGRRAWAERYAQGLRGASGLVLPTETAGSRHARHLYVVHTREPELRNDLLDFLTASGIEVKCHYPVPIHLQAGFPWDRHATIHGPLTNAERNAACCVSLPLFPELTAGEVDYVVERVTAWDRAVASG